MKLSKALDFKNTETVDIDIYSLGQFIIANDWCPGVFVPTQRNIQNFKFTELLALDVDGGLSIEDAIKRFNGFNFIIAPSRNNMKEKNGVITERFRVIIPLEYPITDKETYAATWNSAFELFPFIDAACKDVSRFYYKSTHIAHFSEGVSFPITEPTKPQRVVGSKRAVTVAKVIPPKALKFINEGSEENWNQNLFKTAKLMQENGFEEEETISILEKMSNPYYSGVLDFNDLKTIRSAFTKPGKYAPTAGFPITLTTKHGEQVPDPRAQDNFIYLLDTVLNKQIKYNELRNTIELNGKEINDYDFSEIRMACRNYALNPTQEMLDDVIRFLAKQNSYHPFKSLLENQAWDGHDYIEDLYKTLTIEGEELPIYRTYLKRWIIGMIARVYNPGSHQNVLVLQGKQGAKKSRWFERFNVAPGTFHEGSVDPSSKDDKIKTASVVMWVLSELDGITRKRDVAELKSFLTDTVFDVRSPYDRYSKQMKAICSFAASVNESSFLADMTGNRRFLVIPIKETNPLHNIDMVKLLVQAKSLYESGERYWFDQEEIAVVNSINEDYVASSRIEYLTYNVEPGVDEVSADDILTLVGFKDSRGPGDYVQLGHAMTKKGITRVRKSSKGIKLTYYMIDRKTATALKAV